MRGVGACRARPWEAGWAEVGRGEKGGLPGELGPSGAWALSPRASPQPEDPGDQVQPFT